MTSMHITRALMLTACASACGTARPPPLVDSDASTGGDLDGATRGDVDAPFVDADAGAATQGGSVRDYHGVCTPGMAPVWHFHDFMTHTPGDSHFVLTASSSDTAGGLAAAPTVLLGVVGGPDITTWAGIDVAPKLKSIGQRSLGWLRVVTESVSDSGDAGAPQLKASRQLYNCVLGQ